MRHDQSCYLFVHQTDTWNEALAYCKLFGATLAEVTSSSENTFLKSELKQFGSNAYGYWIGGVDLEVDGEWKWVSSDRVVHFTDWNTGEPNGNRNENCIDMLRITSYTWNDEDCHSRQQYICEQDLDYEPHAVGR